MYYIDTLYHRISHTCIVGQYLLLLAEVWNVDISQKPSDG